MISNNACLRKDLTRRVRTERLGLIYLLSVLFILGNRRKNQDGGIRCGENWAKKGGSKLVLIDYTLPLLSKIYNTNIQDFTIHSNNVNKY